MMDTTQAIILTTIFSVVFTGLVGGIIVYTLQKKIDATIQKSVFEHQIRFSTVYPKTLEVLEALNSAYHNFEEQFSVYVAQYAQFLKKNEDSDESKWELITRGHRVEEPAFDFSRLVSYNHIFVPDKLWNEIFDIQIKVQVFESLAFAPESLSPGNPLSEELNRQMTKMGLPVEKIDDDDKSARLLQLHAILDHIVEQGERLDKLYKSVAEAK